MAIPLRPGVYNQEIDNSISLIVGGLGAIAVTARLEKGEIDRPLSVNDATSLQRIGGKPIPQFNTEDWAYINNLFFYTSNILVSRVEELTHNYKPADAIYVSPCENAQSVVYANGSTVNANNKFNVQALFKTLSTTANTRLSQWNSFLTEFLTTSDVIHPENIDYSLLIKNSLVDPQDEYSDSLDSKSRLLNSGLVMLSRGVDGAFDTNSDKILKNLSDGSLMAQKTTGLISSLAKITNLSKIVSINNNYFYESSVANWEVGARVFVIDRKEATGGTLPTGTYIIDEDADYPYREIGEVIDNSNSEYDASYVDIRYTTSYTLNDGDVLCVLTQDMIDTADGSYEREKILNALDTLAQNGDLGTTSHESDYTYVFDLDNLGDEPGVSEVTEAVIFNFIYLKESKKLTEGTAVEFVCYPNFTPITNVTVEFTDGTDENANKEVFRSIAKTPGKWADRDLIETMICPMIEVDGVSLFDTFMADYFDYSPTPGVNTTYALDQFAYVVWVNGSITERYIASVNPSAKDDSGNSKYFNDLINKATQYAYVTVNDDFYDADTYEFNTTDLENFVPTKAMLLGGNSSTNLYALRTSNNVEYSIKWNSVQAVKEALKVFEDKSAVTIEYVCDGAFAGQPQIKDAIVQLCAVTRRDCVAILGPKSDAFKGVSYASEGYDALSSYIDWISTSADNQFAIFYANTKMVYDSINDIYVWISCSSDGVALNSRVDRLQERWFAVAGPRRGVLTNIIKLGWYPDDTHREYMTKDRLNPVIYVRDEGNMIYDTMSMCALNSDLSEIYNRKTLNYLQVNTEKYLRKVNFEFNDEATRLEVVDTLTPFFRSVFNRRGLAEEALIQCNDQNNTASVIEQNMLIVDISLKLQHVAKRIVARWRINKTSATLEFVQEA